MADKIKTLEKQLKIAKEEKALADIGLRIWDIVLIQWKDAYYETTVKILTTFENYVVEYIVWFWIKDHNNWVIWLPWYTEKRMQQEIDGVMKNHTDHVCIVLRKNDTVEDLMSHFSSYTPTKDEK